MMCALARHFALWVILVFASAPAFAQGTADSAVFRARAEGLVAVLQSQAKAESFFAPSFLTHIPATQIEAIAAQLRAQNGTVIGVESITPVDTNSGVIVIGYEKALVTVNMTIDTAPPQQVIGLLIAAVKARGDSADKVSDDLRALPGKAGLLVTRLDDPKAKPVLGVNTDHRFAIGSGFKLWVLAEATRSVQAGERTWRSVIPLGPPSTPSGILQKWPTAAPLTLHSLATLMISISDNSATDTLLRVLGRDKVGAMVGATGHGAPMQTLPLLSTVEMFALKMEANADVRQKWMAGSFAARQSLLKANAARLTTEAIRGEELATSPRYIDQIEWFASPADMAKTLDWLRRAKGLEARSIMAVNPGIPPGQAARFAYVGYKGGSETGVIAMNLLIQTKTGAWYSVTGAWNNGAAAVDQAVFTALISRAVDLIP